MADNNQPERPQPPVNQPTDATPDKPIPSPLEEQKLGAAEEGLKEVGGILYSAPGITGADDGIVQNDNAASQAADKPPGELTEAARAAKFGDGRNFGTAPGQRHPVTLEVNPEGGENNPHNLALTKDASGNYSELDLDYGADILGARDSVTPGDDGPGGDNPEDLAAAARGAEVADTDSDDDGPEGLAAEDDVPGDEKVEVKEDGGTVVTAAKKEGGERRDVVTPVEGETETKQDKPGSGGGTVTGSGSGSGTLGRTRGGTEARMDQVEGKKPTSDGNGTANLQAQIDRLKAGHFIKDGQDGRFQSGDSLTDRSAKEGFGKQLNDFLARTDITDQQKADALKSVTDVLEMKQGKDGPDGSPYSQAFREAEMTSLMENMAKWDSIDQGNSNRCNVYQVSSASSYLKPETMAARSKDILQDGKWDIPASESSTGKPQSVDMRDVLDKQVADHSRGAHRTTDGANGQSTMHGDLDTIAMAKLFNQERGLIYSVGEPTKSNPTGETLHRIARNADGSYAKNDDGSLKKGALHSEGSPGMTAADVADMAKNPALKMADQVTITADQSWKNGRSTDNLTVLGNGPGQKTMDQVAKDIQSKDKHYLIMHVAGNDRAVVDANGQSHARGAGSHAGHSIGAAWNKNVNINENRFAAGKPEGGTWKGNNTWGGGNDDIWDRNIVGTDGKLKSDMVASASNMETHRGGGGGGSVPYQDWHRTNPGVNKDGGTIQRNDDKDSNRGREEHKKQQEKDQQANKEKDNKDRELAAAKDGKDPDQSRRAQRDAMLRAQGFQQQYLAAQAKASELAGRTNLDSGGQAVLDAAKSAAELYRGLASDVFRSA